MSKRCCLKKNLNASRPLFLTFSVSVANPKKATLHDGQSRTRSDGEKEKEKKKSGSAPPPPPPPPRCAFGEKKKNYATHLHA